MVMICVLPMRSTDSNQVFNLNLRPREKIIHPAVALSLPPPESLNTLCSYQ